MYLYLSVRTKANVVLSVCIKNVRYIHFIVYNANPTVSRSIIILERLFQSDINSFKEKYYIQKE